jgi:hypothetical protein
MYLLEPLDSNFSTKDSFYWLQRVEVYIFKCVFPMTSIVYAFSRCTRDISLCKLILINLPYLRAFTLPFDTLRLITSMPKWISHPKKARSAQQKAHTNTLVGRQTELPRRSDRRDPSPNLSAVVESLSTALENEKRSSEYLRKDVKNATQREKRAKTKVGCLVFTGSM